MAQAINFGTQHIVPWGWRLSLGLAAIPGAILAVGGCLLPETPNSLIERGHRRRGRAVTFVTLACLSYTPCNKPFDKLPT